jgi:hypothetical protein
MVSKDESPSLESLFKDWYITESDSDIIRLLTENSNLKILQSKDSYDWVQNKGRTEHILSMTRPDQLKYFDDKYDLYLINMDRLKQTGNSFLIKSDISCESFSERDSIPDLKKLNLQFNYNGTDMDLTDYSIIESERYLEYPNPIEGSENLNKTTLTRLYSKKLGKELTVVYRQTIKNNDVIGSRIYMVTVENKLKLLDMDKNQRLVGFMSAVDYWHDNELTEKKTTVKKFGEESNSPSYLSLYR